MRKVLTVFGTRPEAIKMAPVVRALQRRTDDFHVVTCVTAQHRDMLDSVLGLFGMVPDFDLDVMEENQSLFSTTINCMMRLRKVYELEQPDLVVVQGDTTTTFAASLAAFYLKIPVAHVEAGLRTADKNHPFPEEANRRLTGCVADLHFCPTERAATALRREGVPEGQVFVTGNTVIDALLGVADERRPYREPALAELDASRRTVVLTAHRRESFGAPLVRICEAVRQILEAEPDLQVVYPVHPNPNVREVVEAELGEHPRVRLTPPLDYADFVGLLRDGHLILTDSGGVQEEAPSLGKPVLVLREKTERTEGIDAGTALLVGTRTETIVSEALRLLRDPAAYQRMATVANPYGDGRASERIADAIALFVEPRADAAADLPGGRPTEVAAGTSASAAAPE